MSAMFGSNARENQDTGVRPGFNYFDRNLDPALNELR